MPTQILIPTPLRPFTDKLDAVEVDGATVGELLADLTTPLRRPEEAPVQRRRQAAELRQRLRQRRGHPLPAEGADAGEGRRHGEHHPVGGRRQRPWRRARRCRRSRRDEIKRYSRHLILPEVGMDGQRKLKARQRALHRRRRARLARRAVPGRGRRRHASASSTSTSSTSATCSGRSCTARPTWGARSSRRRRTRCTRSTRTSTSTRYEMALSLGERARALQATTTSSSTAPTTSRRATWSTTRACCSGKPNAYGSIFRFEGQASVFATKDGPCYRCLYPEPPPPGPGAELRRGRRARRAARRHRHHPGHRGDQADPRHRRAAGRPLAASTTRCGCVPRAEAAARIRTARSAATTRR